MIFRSLSDSSVSTEEAGFSPKPRLIFILLPKSALYQPQMAKSIKYT